jgi:hypothetical protein
VQTPTSADEEVRRLREQLAAKDFELRAAQARAEVALILPRVVQPSPLSQEAEKKTRRRGHPGHPRGHARGRPPGKKKST